MLKFRKKVLILQLIFFSFSSFLFFFTKTPFWVVQTAYGLLTFFSIFWVSRPLQKMIDAIRPLEDGHFATSISIENEPLDEELKSFSRFINALLEKIRRQIRRLQEQKQETEEILDSLEEGVIALDKTGLITFANQFACRQLDKEPNWLIGHIFSSLDIENSPILQSCYDLIQKVLQTSEIAEDELIVEKKEKLYLRLIAYPKARHNGVILMIQDRTADHKVLAIGKDFIANASHELKTPITIIQGFAETLEEHPDLSLQTIREIGHKIGKTSQRLEKLTRSLLTLADLEHLLPGRFQRIDLFSLCEQAVHLFLLSSPHIVIDLKKIRTPLYVIGDPFLLELAITNLLDNAVKYSKEKKEVVITLSKEQTRACIRIEDKGLGIPEQDLAYVFDRFYTVDKARSRKAGGAGLGLSIVKAIIEKHEGKVEVESILGEGSSFFLYFPLLGDSTNDQK